MLDESAERNAGDMNSQVRRVASFFRRLKEDYRILAVSAFVGGIVGFVIAGFESVVVIGGLDTVMSFEPWMLAVSPGIGLIASRLILRAAGGADVSGATADEFIRAFHDERYLLGWRKAVARVVAAVVTLGSGNPLGLEGPSMYAGATIGVNAHQFTGRQMRLRDRRTLLLSGAAAGVAAIFKAPATGAIFALEVPYRDDFARRMLLPVLVSSASGYLAFVVIHGTSPLFPLSGDASFGWREIVGALCIGLIAGLGARLFSRMLRAAKDVATGAHRGAALVVAVVLLAALFWVGRLLTDLPITIGSGFEVVLWVLEVQHAALLLVAVLVIRSLATAVSVAGGGVGGIFIPLVTAGALTGALVSHVFGATDLEMFVVIGMAAFLGSGYRVPLAAVVFVAETTGRPSFIVPGLLAAVGAELMMGSDSVTPYQVRL
jgi:CIC family chloride channel protein